MKQTLALVAVLLHFSILSAQNKIGSSGYANDYDDSNPLSFTITQYIYQSDSAVLFGARVLLNTHADEYVLTYGLDHTAGTSKLANEGLDKQVNSFLALLKNEGIGEKEVYVDYISQTKVYDYKIAGNMATQYVSGFQVKKNIVIRLKEISKFERVSELASEKGIYDLVSVQHILNDKQGIYNSLVKEAMSVIDNKKKQFGNFSSLKLIKDSVPESEKFYSIYPESNYKSYEAYESSSLSNYTTGLIKKDLEKKTTLYFKGADLSAFDKVINEADPRKEIQCVYELRVRYMLKR